MVSTVRQSTDALAWYEKLEAEPYKFDMFSTLRFIDAWHGDKPRIGEAIKAVDEVAVLRQEATMAFAPATVSRFDRGYPQGNNAEDMIFDPTVQKHQLYNKAFGMFGPNGAMPLHITELAFSRRHNHGDLSLCRFADVFHHRMLCLFYRAESNTQPVIEMDRPLENNFDLFVGALAGLANKNEPPHHQGELLEDLQEHWQRLHRSGLLAMANKPADGLKSLLQDALQASVQINQFTGGWLFLEKSCQFKLDGWGEQFQLGVNTTLGASIFDVQHKFTVQIGPLDLDKFRRLLPHTNEFAMLRDMIRLYCGDEYDWDIDLILKKEQIPPMQLGGDAELGWACWSGAVDEKDGDFTVSLKNKGF